MENGESRPSGWFDARDLANVNAVVSLSMPAALVACTNYRSREKEISEMQSDASKMKSVRTEEIREGGKGRGLRRGRWRAWSGRWYK